MKRPGKRWLWLIPCVMALAVGLFLLLRSRTASLSAPAPSAALLQASDGLDEIELQAEFLPESRSLRVTQRMALTSRVDDARDTLVLRTWPNAYQSMETSPLTLTELYDAAYPEGFSTGALVMEEAAVAHGDGAAEKVFYRYTDTAKTVLSLPLAQSWGCGETLTVTLRYTLMLPKAASRYGVMNGVYAVGNAFPLPALYENGAYRTDDYSPIGDPFVSECANFSLELTLPDGYQCAATSFPSETRQDGERQVMTFSAPAVRDFALVLSQQFQAVQAMEGNVLVSVYAPDGNWARQALAFARAALRCYNELYGDYPYPSLTLTGSTLPYDGAEYPGLCLLSSSLTGDELEKAAAHEVVVRDCRQRQCEQRLAGRGFESVQCAFLLGTRPRSRRTGRMVRTGDRSLPAHHAECHGWRAPQLVFQSWRIQKSGLRPGNGAALRGGRATGRTDERFSSLVPGTICIWHGLPAGFSIPSHRIFR